MIARQLLFLLALTSTLMSNAAADEMLTTGRIAQFSGDYAAAISYTFDDGLRDQYTAAEPMLNEEGFRGTFFIIPTNVADTTADAERRKMTNGRGEPLLGPN